MMEKYLVLRINTKSHQLIKHAKISYPIALLAFRIFSCGTYLNGLNRGFLRLMHSKYLKKYKSCCFCCDSAFRYTRAQGAVSQKFTCVSKSQCEFKIRNYGRASIDIRFLLLAKDIFLENKNLTSNNRRWTNLHLTLNSWRCENL